MPFSQGTDKWRPDCTDLMTISRIHDGVAGAADDVQEPRALRQIPGPCVEIGVDLVPAVNALACHPATHSTLPPKAVKPIRKRKSKNGRSICFDKCPAEKKTQEMRNSVLISITAINPLPVPSRCIYPPTTVKDLVGGWKAEAGAR